MEFQMSHFKYSKMMLLKCCTQYANKYGKRSSGHRTGKGQFSFKSQRKGNVKECLNYCTTVLISHASKLMLKILQARLQQYVNQEIPDVQGGFRKSRGTRHQVNIHWIIEKAREFQQKTYSSASLTMLKPLTVWIATNCGKFFKRWESHTTVPASWETCVQDKKQPTELEIEQQNCSKLGRE